MAEKTAVRLDNYLNKMRKERLGHQKIIQAGKMIEIWQYEKPFIGSRHKHVRKKKRRSKPLRSFRSAYSARQKKKAFQRLVVANIDAKGAPMLLSLTYAENMMNLKQGWADWSLFWKRLRYYFKDIDLQYIAVPEFQKRGAVHFHVLLWGLPYEFLQTERNTRHIASLWGKGFVDIVQGDTNPALAGYLAKYLSKTYMDARLLDRRCYSTSRGVERPTTLTSTTEVAFFKDAWSGVVDVDNFLEFSTKYDTKWLGSCYYKRIRIN